MIEFIYFNNEAVSREYGQLDESIKRKVQETKKTSGAVNGKIKVGSFLQAIGINIGSFEGKGDLKKEFDETSIFDLSDEQKLFIVLGFLKKRKELKHLNDDNVNEDQRIIFEDKFKLEIIDDAQAKLISSSGKRKLIIHFSKQYANQTTMSLMTHYNNEYQLSGYGTIFKILEYNTLLIKPTAFGKQFMSLMK